MRIVLVAAWAAAVGNFRDAEAVPSRAAVKAPSMAVVEARSMAAVEAALVASDAQLPRLEAMLQQADAPLVESSSESYLDQLQDSLVQFVIGLVLIPFAMTALWVNERRSADQWALLSDGEEACVPLEAGTPDGTLVHVSGVSTSSDTLTDSEFGIKAKAQSARLRRTGRIYQWVEKAQHEQQSHMGGRRETTTTTYCEKEWCEQWVDASHFRSAAHNNGPRVEGLHKDFDAAAVSIDRAKLSPSQIGRLQRWEPLCGLTATPALGREWRPEMSGSVLYSGKGSPTAPEVGDIEMKFEQVPCGDTTVVGLLVADSFLPYRPVDMGLWSKLMSVVKGADQDAQQQALLAAARDDEPALWSCGTLCCICNTVERLFHAATPVQVDYVTEAQQEKRQAFKDMAESESSKVWGIRFGSWLAMYIGLVLVFSPLIALLNFLPFLAAFGSFIVYVFAFFVTACVSILIISVAYLAYRPIVALVGFGVVAGLMALTQAPPVKAF